MAKSVLDIVIKLSKQGGADKETITGLVKVKSALLDAAAVAGTFVAAGYAIKTVLDQTVAKHVAYAAEVRRASEATGMTTEETSRLIQVLDDVKIEYSALEKVIQKNGDTMNYTTDGLASMSAEYLSLSSANEQAAFMQERFGKQWISFVPLMRLGEDGIRQLSAGIDENLIITEKAEAETRQYEIAVDNMSDAWQSFTFGVAPPLMNALTKIINSELDVIRAREILKGQGFGKWDFLPIGAWEAAEQQARAEREAAEAVLLLGANSKLAAYSVSELASSQKDATSATEDLTEASETLWKQQADQLLSTTLSLTQADDDYTSKLADLDAQLRDNTISAEEYQAGIESAAAAHTAATNQIIFDIAKMQLAADGWQQGDTAAMLAIGQQLGILSEQQIESAKNIEITAGAYARLAGVTEAQTPIVVEAVDLLTAQLAAGSLTTMQYKQKVDALYNSIGKLNGLEASAVINLIVNGSVPNFAGQVQHRGYVMRAAGGPLADMTIVGEKGYELVVKGKDGQYTVIPHEAAAWMMRAGMMPGAGMAEGGTLGALGAAAVSSVQNVTNNHSVMTGGHELQRELRSLNAQMRGLRSELPSALAAAMARSI